MFLLLVVTLVVMYEVYKLINMSELTMLLDGMKKHKGNDTRTMNFVGSKSSYTFIVICEFIYMAIFIYLFFTVLYPVAAYMLVSMIAYTIIDKAKGSPHVGFRYVDSVLTITLIILAYVFLVGGTQ